MADPGTQLASAWPALEERLPDNASPMTDFAGVVLKKSEEKEREFYEWALEATDPVRIHLSYPGAGPSTTVSVDEFAEGLKSDTLQLGYRESDTGRIQAISVADTGSPEPEDSADVNEQPTVTGDYRVSITPPDGDTVRFGSDDQSEVMQQATNYLIDSHNLIEAIEPLPWIPGRSKAVINTTATYPDGDEEMRHYKELVDGYYLDTHYKVADKRRRLKQMVEAIPAPIQIEFDGGW